MKHLSFSVNFYLYGQVILVSSHAVMKHWFGEILSSLVSKGKGQHFRCCPLCGNDFIAFIVDGEYCAAVSC